jgi:hypothetical protein
VHETALFLGHFHPVWVHLPIGILVLLGILEVASGLSRLRPFAWLPALGPRQRTLILALGAAAAVVAAGLGWLLSRGGDYDPGLLRTHQWLGFASAGAALLLLAVHRLRWAYPAALALALSLLVVAAHAGGQISHGTDYLTGHMPPALGRLLRITVVAPPKPPPVDFKAALVYADVVAPILRDRCVTCHGGAKSSGGLRVDTWEFLARGGKGGAVLRPSAPAAGEFLRRIELPLEDKAHMPPRGKPQLPADDLTLLEWWIAIGSPHDPKVADLDLPAGVDEALGGRLGGMGFILPPDRAATLARARALEPKLGILIRSVSADGPWVDVNARPAGRAFDDTKLAALLPIASAIRWLDLGATGVDDAGLAAVDPMRRLERLHLDGTAVTDAGLEHLAHLRRLQYLNLRGTKVDDQGLAALKGLTDLRAVYAWETGISPGALKALGDSLVNRRKIAAWRQQHDDLERKIRAEQFIGNTGAAQATPIVPVVTPTPH